MSTKEILRQVYNELKNDYNIDLEIIDKLFVFTDIKTHVNIVEFYITDEDIVVKNGSEEFNIPSLLLKTMAIRLIKAKCTTTIFHSMTDAYLLKLAKVAITKNITILQSHVFLLKGN